MASVDRRAYDDAISIAELFREARTRAMGKGAAEMVAMTQVGGFGGGDRGTFLLWEGQVLNAPPIGILPIGSPMATCGTPTVWTGGGQTAIQIDGLNLNNTAQAQNGEWTTITAPAVGGGVATLNAAYLCFTPLGRAYFANAAPPTFVAGSPMIGELQITVQHTYAGVAGGVVAGIVRTVIIPNSGATRIVSH
jgi:hypothetical protein